MIRDSVPAQRISGEDRFVAVWAACSESIRQQARSSPRGGSTGREIVELVVRELAILIETEPAVARRLLVEPDRQSSAARGGRADVRRGLAKALDRAFREDGSTAPRSTGTFMVATIEAVARKACAEGDPAGLEAAAAELAEMVAEAYVTDSAI